MAQHIVKPDSITHKVEIDGKVYKMGSYYEFQDGIEKLFTQAQIDKLYESDLILRTSTKRVEAFVSWLYSDKNIWR